MDSTKQKIWAEFQKVNSEEAEIRETLSTSMESDMANAAWKRWGKIKQSKAMLMKLALGWLPPKLIDPTGPTNPVDPLTPAKPVEFDVESLPFPTTNIVKTHHHEGAPYVRGALERELERTRLAWDGRSTPMDLYISLPFGEVDGVALNEKEYGLSRVNLDWISEHTKLHIIGHPSTTTILAAKDRTFVIEPGTKWKGNVCFYNCKFQGSRRNTFLIGTETLKVQPLEMIGFVDCGFVDNPDPMDPTVRIVSRYQSQCYYVRCYVDSPESVEHFDYNRNPYGPQLFFENECKGVGSQFSKEVARPDEGPLFDPAVTYLVNNNIRNCHREMDPDLIRGGAALEYTDTRRDYVILNNNIIDLEREDGSLSYGALTLWAGDGDRFPITYGQRPIGHVDFRGNTVDYSEGNRTLINVKSAAEFNGVGNSVRSPNKGIKIRHKTGVDAFTWKGNSGNVNVITPKYNGSVSADVVGTL